MLLSQIITTKQLTGDQILILEAFYEKDYTFLENLLMIEKQRNLLLQNLIRRGYLNLYEEEMGYELFHNVFITDKGEEIISLLKEEFDTFKKKEISFSKSNFEHKFQEFWDTFPSSDKFMHFPRSRVLKTELEKCRKIYKKLLEDYTHEEIMKALNFEINMRESNSATGLNKPFSDFKYMKASSTWLNNKEFLSLKELMDDDNIEHIDTFSNDV